MESIYAATPKIGCVAKNGGSLVKVAIVLTDTTLNTAFCVVLRSKIAVVIARRGLLLSSIGSVLFAGLLTRRNPISKASLDKT